MQESNGSLLLDLLLAAVCYWKPDIRIMGKHSRNYMLHATVRHHMINVIIEITKTTNIWMVEFVVIINAHA